MIAAVMERFDPLSETFCASAKGQALLDEIAARKPWRRGWRLPGWWCMSFFRRGLLSFHTIAYAGLAFRDPWTLLLVGLAVIVFEWRFVPRAMDLRLGDRAFVELVLSGREIETAGGSAEVRRVWRGFAAIWLAGVVVAVPLWWLARAHASGLCADIQEADMTCRLAAPGMTAFKAWFGLLTLGPLAYTSARFPLLLPMRCPSMAASGPALHRWTDVEYGRKAPALPRWGFLYLFPLVSSFVFVIFSAALGRHVESMLNPAILLGACAMGGFHALSTLQFRPEFKAWTIVRDFQETEYAEARTKPLRA